MALPVLNDHEAELITILQQAGRLSNDVADLLLATPPSSTPRSATAAAAVQVLYDRRTQVVPLVIGLRQYIQTLTEVIRIDVGDGTLMGAVKGILGNQICRPGPVRRCRATRPPPRPGRRPRRLPVRSRRGPARHARGPDDGDLADLLRRVLGA